MRHLGLCLLVIAGSVGCERVSPSESRLRQRLHSISLSDGVSQAEASIIAECYFDREVGCGGFLGIRDGGSRWIVEGAFGVAGKPVQGFYIEKQSGRVTSPIGPSYDDPFQIYP